jgi:type IV secretion system protein VirB4
VTATPTTAPPSLDAKSTWREAKAQQSLSEFVTASSLLSASDVITKEGDYFRVYELDGLPFETASPERISSAHEAFCTALRMVSGGHFAVWYHRARWLRNEELPAIGGELFDADFDRAYNARVSSRPFLSTHFFLTLIYRPEPTKLARMARSKARTLREIDGRHADAMRELDEKGAGLERALSAYSPRLLTERLDRQGRRYSEVAELLGYLINGEWMPVRAPVIGPLYKILPAARATFSKTTNSGRLQVAGSDTRYVASLDIQDYEGVVEPGCLGDVLTFEHEFIETQSFSILQRPTAVAWLEKQRKQLIASEDVVAGQVAAMDDAKEEVAAGTVLLGEYHYSLSMFADDPIKATRLAATVAGAVGEAAGLKMVPIDLVPHAGWFAQQPCNWQWRTRSARITNRAFGALAAPHSSYTGKRDGNPWGPAVLLLRTAVNEPYFLNFHAPETEDDVEGLKHAGNTLVLGATGSGKTTAVLAALTGSQRCNPAPRMLLLDYGRGMDIWTRAMGGKYFVIRWGEPTGLNPFQKEMTANRRGMLVSLVKKMIETPAMQLMPDDEESIAMAVDALAGMPVEKRTPSVLRQFLPRSEANSIYDRFGKWCRGGEFGWVFDMAPERMPDVSTEHIIGIDYKDVLDQAHPIVVPVLMRYLWDVLEQMCDGRRLICSIAEFWRALGDPMFTEIVKTKLKTIRKENGIVVLDSQEPDDALRSEIGRTIVTQTQTKILLHNPAPERDAYVESMGLSQREFETVKGFHQGSRSFLVKQGQHSAVVSFDLSGMDDELFVLSSSLDNALLLDEIRKDVGDDPRVWLPVLKDRARSRRQRKELRA